VAGSSVVSVRRRAEGAPEPQVVETFRLSYATVASAAQLIRELLPENAKVSEFASRNMIVVKSTESSLGEIRSVLDIIDIVRQQVFIESKFMELSDGAQQDLGIDWQVLQGYSAGTVGPTERSSTKTDSTSNERNSFTDSLGRPYAEGNGFVDGATLDGNFPVFEGLTPLSKAISSDGTTEILTSVLSADESAWCSVPSKKTRASMWFPTRRLSWPTKNRPTFRLSARSQTSSRTASRR